jgi:hypothetical protein
LGHCEQLDEEATEENVPAPHELQLLASAAENSPAEHCLHTVSPVSAYFPASHVVHTLAPAALNLPGLHLLQLPAPAAENSPAEHCLHTDSPVHVYLPASHVEHTPAPATLNLPGVHLLQLPAPAAENSPAGHCLHTDSPVHAYFPGSHVEHTLAPAALNLPDVHSAHTLLPDAAEYAPAAQLAHEVSCHIPTHAFRLDLSEVNTTHMAYTTTATTRFALTAQRVNDMLERHIAMVDSELETTRQMLADVEIRQTAAIKANAAQAFCMGHHQRLGGDPSCRIDSLPADLLPVILQTL